MDSHYDVEGAKNALEQSASENFGVDDYRLASLLKVQPLSSKIRVVKVDGPQTWRLASITEDTDSAEEIVFRLQGIIADKKLPPVTEKTRHQFLRQGITLTGLGSPTFEAAISAAQELYGFFDRTFEEGKLEPWTTSVSEKGHENSIDISNRFFTPRKDAPNMEQVAFGPGVDPRGYLNETASRGEYIHGEDNTVSYFTREVNEKGHRSFQSTQPHIFRLGDIVEAQLSFVVVPVKGGRRKLMPILRSIALLCGYYSQDAQKKRGKALQPQATLTLKRKVGYKTDWEMGERSKTMGDMD